MAMPPGARMNFFDSRYQDKERGKHGRRTIREDDRKKKAQADKQERSNSVVSNSVLEENVGKSIEVTDSRTDAIIRMSFTQSFEADSQHIHKMVDSHRKEREFHMEMYKTFKDCDEIEQANDEMKQVIYYGKEVQSCLQLLREMTEERKKVREAESNSTGDE